MALPEREGLLFILVKTPSGAVQTEPGSTASGKALFICVKGVQVRWVNFQRHGVALLMLRGRRRSGNQGTDPSDVDVEETVPAKLLEYTDLTDQPVVARVDACLQ